jgi:Tudor domain
VLPCLDLSSFKSIINRVQKHYSKTKPQSTVTWKVDCPVAALFADDGSFYRAKVIGFDDKGIKVIFLNDYLFV